MFCICLSRRSYKRDLSLPISYHTTALQCNKNNNNNNNNNILYTGGTLLHHVFVHNARVAFLCSSSALQWMEQCFKRSKETQQTWVRCFLLRLSYSPASTLRFICFLLKSSKFHATFSPRIFALRCFALFRFTEQIRSEYTGMYRAIRAVSSGKTREKKILVSLPASFFSFRTVLFHLLMITSAFLSVRLFQNTSQVSLCSCGLCPFILLNYCTVVHYKRGNKSKEGKIGFETKAVFTLGARALVPEHRHKMVLCSYTGYPIYQGPVQCLNSGVDTWRKVCSH